MGEILIAGMASMLITIFLGPKFIEYLRVREFGQHIREDGPEGHHTKAGTPTMGGLIIFAAIVVPYLVLSERDASSLAVFGATDDVATGPTGASSRVVREPVDCSPCLLRECPIDHRCMTRVTADRVVETALTLIHTQKRAECR